MTLRTLLLSVIVLGLSAGCGDQEEDPAPAAAGPGVADVRVVVDADGDGARAPVSRRVRCAAADRGAACAALRQAPSATWSPVPGDQACTQLYGGPQTARVTGVVDGRRVDARLSRTNGCEIARWRVLGALLDPLARRG